MKNRLKIIRAERGLSQDQLAQLVGITRANLNRIEKEKSVPSGKTIMKISQVLSLAANDIFFIEKV